MQRIKQQRAGKTLFCDICGALVAKEVTFYSDYALCEKHSDLAFDEWKELKCVVCDAPVKAPTWAVGAFCEKHVEQFHSVFDIPKRRSRKH